MPGNDDFELWLGRAGKSGGKPRARLASGVIRSANLAGGWRLGKAGAKFDGSRIGRGSGVGRLLANGRAGYDRSRRRVVVKTSIVRLGAKGLARARAHMRYLQREGTTREGERGALYGADVDRADGKAFVERGAGDRHQFRFIVAPEDGSEYAELKPLVRRLMEQAGQDLGTGLDWVAVDHFNTGHPHAHVLVRGKDELGKDLVIARDYLAHGLRERACALVDLDLGPRSEREIWQTEAREVEQERFTRLDRRILAARDPDGLVDPRHRDVREHDLRIARLRRLARMGLAEELASGRWKLGAELEPVLRRMGERGDIVKTLHRALKHALPTRGPQDQAIYEPGRGERLVGRLVASGLSDEHADRRYLILDATDGRSHYVDIGRLEIDIAPGAILSVTARPVAVREADRTVAAVAAAHGGRYTVDMHLAHDPQATDAFAQAHVRRLEAIRRATGTVTREADGSWTIASDHLERVEQYERRLAARMPVAVETLSARALENLPGHDGATWLDRELAADAPTRLARGFGAEVKLALDRRRQWLMAQQLAGIEGGEFHHREDMIERLERRELRRVAATLSRELGLPFAAPASGERIEGICRKTVEVGDRTLALIERSHEFTLVPWRPVLERALGRTVSGIVRDAGGISWSIGRGRSGPSIG